MVSDRRPDSPLRRSAADALDALISESEGQFVPLVSTESGPPIAGPTSGGINRTTFRRILSLSFFLVGFGGLLTDAIAASQLLADSGSGALAIVWPIGGAFLLVGAIGLSIFVDRLPRRFTLIFMSSGISAILALAFVLEVVHAPALSPAILEWIAADQLNFLVPLVLWSIASDVFVAGEAAVVFPRISRWWFVGQASGLLAATLGPWVASRIDVNVELLVALPAVCCLTVALAAAKLSGTTSSKPHGKPTGVSAVVSDTLHFVSDLPGFRRLLITSLFVMTAGVTIEFGFLDALSASMEDAGSMQTTYSAISLAGFAACFVIQSTGFTTSIQRRGVALGLLLLPCSALVAALMVSLHSVRGGLVIASVGLMAWRIPRWSIDVTVRQSALATLPDHRRTRVSMLIDLVPWAIGLCLIAVPIGIGNLIGQSGLAPASGAVLAGLAVMTWRRLGNEWDSMQFSYRLKRRQRSR